MGIRDRYIEDKSSGIGLIDTLNHRYGAGFIQKIERDRDKVARLKAVLNQYRQGKVVIPRYAPWSGDYVSEHERFNEMDTHAHDDQVDTTVDAIQVLLIDSGIIDYTGML